MVSIEKPSRTASKIALNIVTLGAKSGMDEVLPDGIVGSTAKLLVESGAANKTGVRMVFPTPAHVHGSFCGLSKQVVNHGFGVFNLRILDHS